MKNCPVALKKKKVSLINRNILSDMFNLTWYESSKGLLAYLHIIFEVQIIANNKIQSFETLCQIDNKRLDLTYVHIFQESVGWRRHFCWAVCLSTFGAAFYVLSWCWLFGVLSLWFSIDVIQKLVPVLFVHLHYLSERGAICWPGIFCFSPDLVAWM